MTSVDTKDYYHSLVYELVNLSTETEWVEFKRDNAAPDEIGEYISALSNSAALCGKFNAYMLWGIEDQTHAVVGTGFRYRTATYGNEQFENWLLRLLSPKIGFQFREIEIEGKVLCLLEIECARSEPVRFKGQEYVRIGSYKKKLKDHPDRERKLWRLFDATPFERQVAAHRISSEDVLKLISYPDYFRLMNVPLPNGADAILECIRKDDLIWKDDSGHWNITNLGAILFARNLSDFHSLKRKAVRVVQYKGESRIETVREKAGVPGYASGFEDLIVYINDLLPSNEVIGKALRKRVPMFPELAVRELVANALIHQDFSQTGNGPMIEIFDNRMEITNPGLPLVKTERFLDAPPKSRNETMASLMRRIGVCEERGSGIDKVVFQAELYQLPAPRFEIVAESTRAALFAHKELSDMGKDDKTHACYLHACLRYVSREPMTNSSLRGRFEVEEQNRAIISRIISDTLAAGLILPFDPSQGRRHAKYVPYWAGELEG